VGRNESVEFRSCLALFSPPLVMNLSRGVKNLSLFPCPYPPLLCGNICSYDADFLSRSLSPAFALPPHPPNTLLCVEAYVSTYLVCKRKNRMGNNVRRLFPIVGDIHAFWANYFSRLSHSRCYCVAVMSMGSPQRLWHMLRWGQGNEPRETSRQLGAFRR
jgi:hypothetical protein